MLVSFFRFDRDWKKIEDFVGSKTVIQVWKQVILPFRLEICLILGGLLFA